MRFKLFPKRLYVRIDRDRDNDYLVSFVKAMDAVDEGDVRVGVYELTSVTQLTTNVEETPVNSRLVK